MDDKILKTDQFNLLFFILMTKIFKNSLLLSGIVLPVFAIGFLFRENLQSSHPARPEKSGQALEKWKLSENHLAEKSKDSLQAESDTLISLIAVGDMMLGTNFPDSSYLPPNRQDILESLRGVLSNADITFGNLEGTVLNSGGDLKKCGDPTKCYAFRQPNYVVDYLKNAGFDFVSVANNHVGDFGLAGRTNTQKVLKEKGIKHAGLDSCPWDTLHRKGLIIGLAAFAPNTDCLQINDYDRAKKVVGELNAMCDIVIVSFHGGAEGSSKTHVTRQKELFVGEDRGNVYEFARVVIDAGADLVLGHGPHVTRAIDTYKGKFITYSMGNFATYKRFNLSGVSGIAPIYKLQLTRKGDFVSGEIIPIQQLGEGIPSIDPQKRVITTLRQLCKEDFPEVKWEIGDDGAFSLGR